VQATALSPVEQRVLGCLIEKRFTTPDQYPLSLNSLRLACNQSTNRHPVTAYEEAAVREAAQLLCRRGLARLASSHTSRAIKYRHLADEALSLDRSELALLAVLLLRGEQTPGELKGRSERMAQIGSLAEVEAILARLGERGLVHRLPRRPGQKEDRLEHRLGVQAGEHARGEASGEPRAAGDRGETVDGRAEGGETTPSATTADPVGEVFLREAPPAPMPGSPGADALARRLGALEERVAALDAALAALRGELAALRAQ
jgi:uncharacterized protein YceH (UPF0502 family)